MKFKNIEELWKYLKQNVPSGVNITTVEKSPSQKIFYMTVPKNLVTANNRKADYDYTFTETAGDIEVFIEPTNDNFSIIDTDDLKELIVFKMNDSVNESFDYVCKDSDMPEWDVKFEFETSLSRKEMEKAFKQTGFMKNHYLLNVLPGGECELYCKKDKTGQFTQFIRDALMESQNSNNMSQQLTQQEQEVVQKMCQGQQLSQEEQKIAQQAQQKLQQQLQQQQESQKTNESEAQDEYRKFFEKKLAEYNVSSPNELSQEQKSKFFSEIKKEWGEQKSQVNEATISARELSNDMMSDFSSAEKKFIETAIPGISKYYQVYRGKGLKACEDLAKKSTMGEQKNIEGFTYTAYTTPKGIHFVHMESSFGDEAYIFATNKINEAEVMKGTGKIYYTQDTVGQLADDALEDAIHNLGATMSSLSNDPSEDSVKAYKDCEDSYQCLKAELARRGLQNVN